MELKSLLLGLAFTVGFFALKSGAGLSYLYEKHKGWPHYLTVAGTFSCFYGMMFLLTWPIDGSFIYVPDTD